MPAPGVNLQAAPLPTVGSSTSCSPGDTISGLRRGDPPAARDHRPGRPVQRGLHAGRAPGLRDLVRRRPCYVVDVATGTVGPSMPPGSGPTGVVVSPDGRRARRQFSAWYAIDTATNMVVDSRSEPRRHAATRGDARRPGRARRRLRRRARSTATTSTSRGRQRSVSRPFERRGRPGPGRHVSSTTDNTVRWSTSRLTLIATVPVTAFRWARLHGRRPLCPCRQPGPGHGHRRGHPPGVASDSGRRPAAGGGFVTPSAGPRRRAGVVGDDGVFERPVSAPSCRSMAAS